MSKPVCCRLQRLKICASRRVLKSSIGICRRLGVYTAILFVRPLLGLHFKIKEQTCCAQTSMDLAARSKQHID